MSNPDRELVVAAREAYIAWVRQQEPSLTQILLRDRKRRDGFVDGFCFAIQRVREERP